MRIDKLNILLGILAFFVACSDDDTLSPSNAIPTIADQTFNVVEDKVVGITIGKVAASDPDGDSLVFSISEINSEETFEIDSLSGELLLKRTLNFNERSTYSLEATVTDGLLDAVATINIIVTPSDGIVNFPAFPGNSFFDGRLQDADYWSDQPEILSAGMGFADISGIEVNAITEELIENIRGAWGANIECDGGIRTRTLASTRDNLELVYIVRDPTHDTNLASHHKHH